MIRRLIVVFIFVIVVIIDLDPTRLPVLFIPKSLPRPGTGPGSFVLLLSLLGYPLGPPSLFLPRRFHLFDAIRDTLSRNPARQRLAPGFGDVREEEIDDAAQRRIVPMNAVDHAPVNLLTQEKM